MNWCFYLVEGMNRGLILAQDLQCVVVRIERVHQNEWYINTVGLIEVLKT